MFDKNKFAKIIQDIKTTYSSQEEFSKKSNIGRTYLSQYMNMKIDKPPKPEILERLAKAANGVTNYSELLLVCGYLGELTTAVYDFSSDNDKKIIMEAVTYALKSDLKTDTIYKNEHINTLLSKLDSISADKALDQIKIEITKGELIYGINTISNSKTVKNKSPNTDACDFNANYFDEDNLKYTFNNELNQKYGNKAIELLDNFQKLNNLGKEKAVENIKDLTEIQKYVEKKTNIQEA